MQSKHASSVANRASLYDEDFYEWTRHNAELLRAGRLQHADIGHIAEQIEDLGKQDLRELNGRVRVLLTHLLKWQSRPERRARSWNGAILAQRIEMQSILKQSPSLKQRIFSELPDNYAKAVRRAVAETGLPRNRFPRECPYTVEQILDPEFLP
jgi:hypothetical protein